MVTLVPGGVILQGLELAEVKILTEDVAYALILMRTVVLFGCAPSSREVEVR